MDKLIGFLLVALGLFVNMRFQWWTGAAFFVPNPAASWLGIVIVLAGLAYLFLGLKKKP